MTIAQRLYEAGLITYMRTDSVNLSSNILKKIHSYVAQEFGEEYLKYKRNVPAFLPVKGKWKQFIQRSGNANNSE